jgi:nucleoside-diphosphate-sugar epimerase
VWAGITTRSAIWQQQAPAVAILKRRRVLVTGASGFIGSRVAEIMHLREGWDVRALVHNPGNASRLARLPVEMVQGDLKGAEAVKRLVDGCDAVVHCAMGTAWGQRKEIFAVTVNGTRLLAESCLAASVERFVHLSTISVYGDDLDQVGLIDEATPMRPARGSEYGKSKTQAEREIDKLAARGLNAVILRPSRVYGPYSRVYVVRPVQAIAERRLRWISDPDVPADMVYVDNVVDAIVRSIDTAALGRGEVFTISDGDDLTWRQFYRHLAKELGLELDAPVYRHESTNGRASSAWWNPVSWMRAGKTVMTSTELKSLGRRVLNTDPLGTLPRWSLERFPALERAARRMVGANGSLPVHRRESLAVNDWVEMGSGGAVVSIDKARRLLGYDPPVRREVALALTPAWVKHARLV